MSGLDSLITASAEAGDVQVLERIPRWLLNDLEVEAVRWILAYHEKHKEAPSLKRLEREASTQLFINKVMLGTPLSDLLELTLDNLKHRSLQRLLSRLEAEQLVTGHYDLEQLSAHVQLLSGVKAKPPTGLKELDRDPLYTTELLDQALDYGWDTLDRYAGGILPGEVHVLVAPLNTGKSMVLCQLVIRWAKQGHRVLVVPGEMTPLQMTARMDGILGKFNPRILRDRSRIEEFPALRARAQAAFKDLLGEVLFPEKRLVTVKDMWAEARQVGATAIAIDGLYLLPNSASAKWEKVTNNSNEVKDGALTHMLPVFETSQLVRGAGEDGKAITTNDVGYAIAIAQDSDVVMSGTLPIGGKPGMAIEVLKNRHGEMGGGVVLEWDWDTMETREAPSRTLVIGTPTGAAP